MNHNVTSVVSSVAVAAAATAHHHGKPIGNEGLFLSHAVLGTCVIGLGLRWWIQSVRKCYAATRRPNGKYQAEASYGSACCPQTTGEGIVKLILCLIGICIEAATEKLGRHHEYTHYPFYLALLTSGLLDILQSTVLFLPEGLDYISHLLPFVFQAYCLRAQAYDQPHVTNACRLLSSYLGVMAAFCILLEMGLRHHLVVSWIKCFSVMLSGAWTWQMGIILNPPTGEPWNEESHKDVMFVAISCAWQMFGVAVVQLVTLLIIAKCQGSSADWTMPERINPRERGAFDSRDHVQYSKLLNEEPLEE